MILRITLLLFLLPLHACSALDVLNASIPGGGYRLVSDIHYGSAKRQQLDVYVPSAFATDSRVIVFVYGGAWRSGEKEDYKFVGQALSSAGHTVVIPNYRLFPEVVFPEFVTDVVMAIKTLNRSDIQHQELRELDFSSIVLMGHSSGAHSVALISSDAQYLADSDISVKGLIALAGPYDLPLENEEVIPVFASAIDPTSTNPTVLATNAHPAALLVHGTDDERVVPRHSQQYFDVLQSLNVKSRLLLVEGDGHAGIIASLAKPLQSRNDVTPEIMKFLDGL